jgi:hypothetical protein
MIDQTGKKEYHEKWCLPYYERTVEHTNDCKTTRCSRCNYQYTVWYEEEEEEVE